MLERNLDECVTTQCTTPTATSQSGRRWSAAALALWVLAATAVVFLGLALFVCITAWHWAEQNVLHAGLQDARTNTVNRTELLKQVQALELVTVKQTYATHTQQSAGQTFNAGADHVALPAWLAGEQVDVQGQVQVAAGVDLARVGADAIHVSSRGKNLQVQIVVPEARVTGAELVPDTLKVTTRTGVLTQLGQDFGLSNDTLRDRAADDLVQAGRDAAIQQGIEANAAHEAQTRLQGFLQQLPESGSHVTYIVAVQ
jgi:hypothetical protein